MKKPNFKCVKLILICITAILLMAVPCTAVYAKEYVINGTVLPLSESGYVPGQYRGSGVCWEFARHIYYCIWHRLFYQNPGSDDDMLRDYPGGEERRITAEHARLFISAAPVGSVIRLQSVSTGPDSTKSNRHSLILLDKTDTGCTVYHDWSGYATIDTFTWAEFENQFRKKIDFGYFKYIKYPGAQALQYDYEGQENTTRELVISTKIQGTVELVSTKR